MASTQPMRILVSGASGFIGTELVGQLEADGHSVIRLVRTQPKNANETHWSPASRMIDHGIVDGVDAVINLSGASTGRIPWTPAYRKEILDSRVGATQTLAQAVGMAKRPPVVFLSGSAVGYYGDQPAVRLTEHSPRGTGFFPDVVAAWESAARVAAGNTRVVNFRTGVVVDRGGAFTPLVRLTKAGLGTGFGTGGQHWPWISLYDEAAAIRHLLTSSLHGVVNLAGPVPAVSDRVTRHLAKRLHRWYALAAPEGVVRAALGDAGQNLLLSSQKVIPEALLADGFTFRDETVEQAIDAYF